MGVVSINLKQDAANGQKNIGRIQEIIAMISFSGSHKMGQCSAEGITCANHRPAEKHLRWFDTGQNGRDFK